MYLSYGNAAAVSQQNAAGVWDINYKGVWHLANGSTLGTNDSTVNGNHGVAVNNPAAVAGPLGGGASFTGSSQMIQSTSNVGIGGNTNYTLSGWIKPNAQSQQGLFGWGSENGQFAGMWYNVRGTGVFSVEYGNSQPAYVANNVAAGVWHYVTFTKTPGAANGTTKIYIDGVDQGAM